MDRVFRLSQVAGSSRQGRVSGVSMYPGGYGADVHTMLLYKLDEGEDPVTVDYSDKGNDGEIFGAQWTWGRYGYGLEYDGILDHTVTPHDATLDLRNGGAHDFTVEALVYPYSRDTYRMIEKPGAYYLGVLKHGGSSSVVRFKAGIWTGGVLQEIQTLLHYEIEQWHHAALRRNTAGYLSLVVDGVEDVVSGSAYGPADVNTNALYTGRGADGFYLDGLIDEVRLSNCFRELSELDPNT